MADPSDNALNRKISDSEALGKEIEAIEAQLAELRSTYEQYFLGVERVPPSKQAADLKKRIQKLQGAFVKQTATKFRIQALQSKYLTYERLWARTLQEMENGTYRRDLFKAKLHQQKRPASAPPTIAPLVSEDAQDPAAPPSPVPPAAAPRPGAAAAQARPGARPGGGEPLSEARLKAVYDAYVSAKRKLNEDVSKLSYESVAANLRKQVPELMKKHNARGVEFKIVIKDGKAVLRAVPK